MTKLLVVFILLVVSIYFVSIVTCEANDWESMMEDLDQEISSIEDSEHAADTLSFDPAYHFWFYGIPSSQHAAYQNYFKTRNMNNMDIAKLTPPTIIETTTTNLNNDSSTTTVVKKEMIFPAGALRTNAMAEDKSWAVYALEQRYMILSIGASMLILLVCVTVSCSCIPVESEVVKQEKQKQQKVNELLELNLEQQTHQQRPVETEYKQV